MPYQYSPLFTRFAPAALALSWPLAAVAALIAVSTGAYFSAPALAIVPVTAAVVLWFGAGLALWRSGGRLLEAPAPVFLAPRVAHRPRGRLPGCRTLQRVRRRGPANRHP